MTRFSGKTVVVTGGGSGIGRAAALRFAEEGAFVVLADANGPALDRVVAQIGDQAVGVVTDVRRATDVRRLIETAVERTDRLDVLANIAGIGARYLITDMDEETFDRVIGVNLKGVWLGTKYAAEKMIPRGGGSIVTVSSISAFEGMLYQTAYAPSKAGASQLMRAAAQELGPYGIRCNAVLPGATATPLVVKMKLGEEPSEDPDVLEEQIRRITADGGPGPLNRTSLPVDIAEAVLFLASDAARQITGVNLVVDGGQTVGPFPPTPDVEERTRVIRAHASEIAENLGVAGTV